MTLADERAEAAWLGYCLERGLEGFVGWPARAHYFSVGWHRAVFNAMERLAERGEPIDLVLVGHELRRHDEVVRTDRVAELLDGAAVSGGDPLRILEDFATRRAMVRAAEHLRAAAHTGSQVPAEAIEKTLDALARQTAAVGRLDEAPEAPAFEARWLEALTHPERDSAAICTGLADVDRLLGDLPRGELTVVGARTSLGKTALAAQIAAVNAAAGRLVLFASAEMTTSQLLDRWRAAAARVPLDHLRRRLMSTDELERLRAAAFPRVRVFDKAAMTTADIRTLVTRLAVMKAPVDLVVVDHLHHLSDPLERNETRYQQIGRMVGALKAMAKQQHAVVLVLAQLNRDAADRVPTLADLRDSGAIEELASIVLLLHRAEKTPSVCELHVAKHRNGPTGVVELYYDAPVLQFRDLDRPRPEAPGRRPEAPGDQVNSAARRRR
jgi:replicative DNA helicase